MRFHTHLQPYVQVPVALAVSACYVAGVVGGARFMQGHSPWSLKRLKLVYNLVQIVVCTAITARLLSAWLEAARSQRLPAPSASAEWWVFIYYCVKICDLGDTAFIVLEKRSRQLSVLHVWHHSSIVPLMAFFLSLGWGGGTASLLPLLNSMVHVVMYAHYLITSVATFEKMWWKPWITRVQISQHIILILTMSVCYANGMVEWPWPVTAVSVLWGLSILGLFVHFYIQQAKERRQKEAIGKAKRDDGALRDLGTPKKSSMPAAGTCTAAAALFIYACVLSAPWRVNAAPLPP